MEPYVSCIKIRGMPILPPLMTDDRRMEMKYYRKLALAVEDKLMKLRIADAIEANEDKINDEELSEMDGDNEACDIQCLYQQSNEATVTYRPAAKEKIETEINSEVTDDACKANSDDDTIVRSTNINKFMNVPDSRKTDVAETFPDIIKPSVPKTLDIVPITVETTNVLKSRQSSSEIEESEEDVPKLVRQGSYTLDTPSPMLLAHLEHSRDDYVPTVITNGMKKRVWNAIDAQAEWEYRTARDSMTCNYSSEKEISSNLRRNSISDCENNKRGTKSVCENNYGASPRRHVVKSVDCIPTMFSKEFSRSSPKVNKGTMSVEKYSSGDGCRYSENQKRKTIENSQNRNLVNKFGGSLGALSNENLTNNKKISQLDNNRMTKSFDAYSTPKLDLSRSPGKLKPVIVSEKLVHVFKDIQKTHERQMADLMARQQKEQIMMQQEFQKQQLILLSKIEKSFPGVALPLLAQKIASSPVDRLEGDKCSTYNPTSLPKSADHNDSQNLAKCSDYMKNRSDPETSPINGSSFESDESISLNFNVSTRERSLAESNLSCERRKSNVSRELFPLESNTTHVPVTNGFIYDQRHIRAATIMNAFARGYLVRRLMKTERVMTLKNTYREALHCMLKLHVDAPLELSELNFHKRLQHQCDAASISIVELFAQNPAQKMEIIAQDRQIRKARLERPNSARSSYSFATQRTLARKRFKEMGIIELPGSSRSTCSARTRCQTWTSNAKEKRSPGIIYQGIKRSTSAGAVRKPWR